MHGAFKTWTEAHAFAQAQADATGRSHGIEYFKFDRRWQVRSIPSDPSKRFGCDMRCEAVEPMRRVS